MGRLKVSNQQNHDAIMTVDRKMEGGLNWMREDINLMREDMGNQLQQFMLMFTKSGQVVS